jgi:hypothetical protein
VADVDGSLSAVEPVSVPGRQPKLLHRPRSCWGARYFGVGRVSGAGLCWPDAVAEGVVTLL